ncbi:MAG: DUF2796 domain-containing protein [Gemmatimonadetes bacterium]|nr:DUF2796 domain-containing protein [Gemmatimonadota bacterium]
MSRMICRSLPVVASLLMLTGVTAAQQSAHVHGIATLNLAMEGDELEIEFVSPAGNIVGFEHEAVTEAERRAIRDAIEQLRKGNELFDLPLAASCSLQVAEVEHGHGKEEKREDGHGHDAEHDDGEEHEHAGDEEHDTHAEREAKHDDGDEHRHAGDEEHGTHSKHETKHDDSDEHGHADEEEHGTHSGHDDGDEHGHDGEEGDTHSEFHARYRCECNGSAIETIGVRLFEYWPRIEAIRVQALTPDGQFGGVAKADDPVIRLR